MKSKNSYKPTLGAQCCPGRNGKALKPMVRTRPDYKLPISHGVKVQDQRDEQSSDPGESRSQPSKAVCLLSKYERQRA